jgi:VCBS repeat-containing protein
MSKLRSGGHFPSRRKRHGNRRRTKRSYLNIERLEERVVLASGLDLRALGFNLLDTPQPVRDGVWFLGTGPSPAELQIRASHNLAAADTTNADQLWAGGGLGLNLTGNGLEVGVWDGGRVLNTHQEFGGRVTFGDSASSFNNHATHVAGTIGAAGVNANARGMASQTHIVSYDWNSDMGELLNANSIVASNHSYGILSGWAIYDFGFGQEDGWFGDRAQFTEDPRFGKYNNDARTLDLVLHNKPNLLSVWSAGNDRNDSYTNRRNDNTYTAFFSSGFQQAGYYRVSTSAFPPPPSDGVKSGYDTLEGNKNSKNSLVIGAVNDATADPIIASSVTTAAFSSYGPTDDGRVKPDLVANGVGVFSTSSAGNASYTTMSGTSMAAPNATGSAVLLIEHHNNLFGSMPRSATTKAVMIHNALDVGNFGPDYATGWGLLDAARSAQFLTAAKNNGPVLFHETSFTGASRTFEFTVTPGSPLKATIVWTDPAGTAHSFNVLNQTTSVLVNNLDLQITGPGGTYFPWTLNPSNPSAPAVRTGPNNVDNVEQVLIDNPEAGTYTITVTGPSSITQPFTILVSQDFTATSVQPPEVELTNKTTSLPEDTDTSARIKVADINLTTYSPGLVNFNLEGPDHALFEIDGLVLYLVAGAQLDHETKPTLQVTVEVDDPTIGGDVDDSDSLTLTITNVNEAPYGLNLSSTTLAENLPAGTEIGTFTTLDQDAGDTFTYTLVGDIGLDNGSFTISGNTLKANHSFDFETKQRYAIRVRTTDSGGLFYEQAFTIQVLDVNEAPQVALTNVVGSIPEDASTAEPIHIADVVVLDDALGDNLLNLSGAFAELFILSNGSLFLKAGVALDHETDPLLQVIVTVHDPGLPDEPHAVEHVLAIADVNEAPTALHLSNNLVAENLAAGTLVGLLTTEDEDVGDSHSYSLVAGSGSDDNAKFKIVGDELQTDAEFDFEAKSSYTVRVRTTDSGGLFYERAFTIDVLDVNEVPTELTLSNAAIAENLPIDTLVGELGTLDPDAGDTFTYALVSGPGSSDNGSFEIVGNLLRAKESFDFETKSSYTVRVRTTDSGGLWIERAFEISILDVNEIPIELNLSSNSVEENLAAGTLVGSFSTLDPDAGDTFTYALVSGTGDADNALFTIVGGQLQTGAMFDFEAKSSYTVRVRTTDSGGLWIERAFTIVIVDVNEEPTELNLSGNTVEENLAAGTVVGNLISVDQDAGDSHTYTLVSGEGDDDNALFTIVGGQLQTDAMFDFEAKSSYTVRVRTTDSGGLWIERAFTILIVDVNEDPTALNLSHGSIAENQPAGSDVGTLSTVDPDAGDTFTYALVSGTGDDDNALFEIVGDKLRTTAMFDFETKDSYTVRVRTTDSGGLWIERAFEISIVDVNEIPVELNLSNNSVEENLAGGTLVGSFSTLDPDAGDTFTYTLVSGTGDADNALFEIVGDKLRTTATFDFEAKNSYTVRVRTTDSGGLWIERVFEILIVDVNEIPIELNLSNNSVEENLAAGTLVGSFSTIDQDANDSFTYALVSGDGDDDNALFTIAGGQLQTGAMFDFEAKSSYSVRVRTTDSGGLWIERMFEISIVDVNEIPIELNLSHNSVAENLAAGTLVGSFSTLDPDAGDTFTYTLVSGTGDADNGKFKIVGGQLRTDAEFDFEAKSSYTVRVRTTDSGGLWIERVFEISIVDVNEIPIELNLSSNTVEENLAAGTLVGSFSTIDQDANDSFTYTLVSGTGDADNGKFKIVGGQLQTDAMFDFEAKDSYTVRVRTTDSGGLWIERVFEISIVDVNEDPTGLELSSTSVFENLPEGSLVGSFTTLDPDAGDSFTYVLVGGVGSDDNGSFVIDGGELKTAETFAYNVKNVYTIRVRTTDSGGLWHEQAFVIDVLQVNEPPNGLALSNTTVAENLVAGTTVGLFSSTDPNVGDTFSYTLVVGDGSADNSAFTIDGATLKTAESFDFETKNSYTIRVRTTDAGGMWFEQIFVIGILDVNEAPTISLINVIPTLSEDTDTSTSIKVADVVVSDDALGSQIVYLTGPDAALFRLVGTTLRLRAGVVLDAIAKPVLRVNVAVDDPTVGGSPDDVALLEITVTNVNRAPQGLALSSSAIEENAAAGTAIGTLSAVDPEGDETLTFALVDGAGSSGNAFFTIDGSLLRSAESFDFEAQSSHSIRVRVTDSLGAFQEKVFVISILDVNEAPSVEFAEALATISDTADTSQRIKVADITILDDALGSNILHLIGADAHLFEIVGLELALRQGVTLNHAVQSQLEVGIAIDDPTVGGTPDATAMLLIQVTDGAIGGSSTEANYLVPSGEPVATGDSAPQVTLNQSVFSLPENTDLSAGLAVGTFDVIDGEGRVNILNLEGPDAHLFTIVGGQLRLRAGAQLDFETRPTLAVRMAVHDAGNDGVVNHAEITIEVSNVNDAPTSVALSNHSVAENLAAGTVVGNFSTTDPDAGDTFTYTLVSGTGSSGNSFFTIVGSSLRTNAAFDFEAQSSYSIRVRSTDSGGLFHEQVFTILVTDVNEAPTVSLIVVLASIPENSSTASPIKVADVVIADDALGSNVVNLAGPHASYFMIQQGQLYLRAGMVLDHETLPLLQVTVAVRDPSLSADTLSQANFELVVADVPEPATISGVSTGAVKEDGQLTAGGKLTVHDEDAGENRFRSPESLAGQFGSFTFHVLTGDWSYLLDNASSQVQALAAGQTVSDILTVTSFDGSASRDIIVSIEGTNDAPLLDAAVVPALSAIDEDNPAPWGTPVWMLLSGATDRDSGALRGVAITQLGNTSSGTWQYTLNGGATWQAIAPVSRSSALLLPTNVNESRIRFVPNPDFEGTVSLKFAAWDRTSGSIGGRANLSASSSTGGSTAFSEQEGTATLLVRPVNDAPVLNSSISPAMSSILEDNRNSWGTPVWVLCEGITDVDAGARRGIAITTANSSKGTWQFTLDGGVTWQNLGAVSSSSARLLPADGNMSRLRFLPNQDFEGTTELGYFGWDQSNGAELAGTLQNVSNGRGGTSAYSINWRTSPLEVIGVNDAPVLDPDVSPALTSIEQGNTSSYGTPIWMLCEGITDVDAGALRGLAITSASTANGTWQYTLNGGSIWHSLAGVSSSAARLLPANGNLSRVRFIPNNGFTGTSLIGYYAWDQSGDLVAGDVANISNVAHRGGTTPYSINWRSSTITVTSSTSTLLAASTTNTSTSTTSSSDTATIGYQLNSSPMLLASGATLSAASTTNVGGGRLRVEVTAGIDAGNRLAVSGSFWLQSVDGRMLVMLGDSAVGVLESDGVGSRPLQIQFQPQVTASVAQQLVRSITFRTVQSKSTATRTVDVAVAGQNDESLLSLVRTIQVVV